MAKSKSKNKSKKPNKTKKISAEKAVSKPLEYADKINRSSLKSESHSIGSSSVARSAPAASLASTSKASAQNSYLQNSGYLLSIAAGIGILMFIAAISLPQGDVAISAFGGLATTQVPLKSAQWGLLLDTLFPIFYGAGLAMLAMAHRRRSNRSIIRMILTGLLVIVITDFAENAMIFKTITGNSENMNQLIIWPITFVKYGTIAFVGVLISTLIKVNTTFEYIVVLLTRYVFPILIAVLISGLGGVMVQQLIATSFPVFLILLAVFAFR